MTLEPGQTLSHYRLVEKIGAGGMGVVWSAEDAVLKRQVAIKVLPEAFSRDPERLGRFQREARALAALNHPNISAIHGLEQAEAVHFLVLELVPGESLAERLARGPLPVPEALRVCGDVARGLESAHEQGVIHRDLKPGNIKITPQGQAKVLDFGLAKALAGPEERADSKATTELFAGTREHMVLGTAPYMSPEQASGREVDRRTDVWAFGCVLYEALTGRQAFAGETVSQTFAAIQGQDPDWERLPADVGPRVRALLRRSLEKDPDRRLRDLGDAWLEIEDARAGREEWTAATPDRRRPSWWTAVAITVAVLAGAVIAAGVREWLFPGREVPPAPVVRFTVDKPEGTAGMLAGVGVSREGAHLVFGAYKEGEPWRLYRHSLERGTAAPVPGLPESPSQGASSPDGKWMAFVAAPPPPQKKPKLWKAPIDGSAPPLVLMDAPEGFVGPWRSLAWPRDEEIVALLWEAESERFELLRIPADGSPPPPRVEVDAGTQLVEMWGIKALPSGRHLLANVFPFENGDLIVIDIETGKARFIPEVRSSNRDYQVDAAWSPTGHILVVFLGVMTALPFDLERREVSGPALAVADGIGRYDVSPAGTLAYRPYVPPPEYYVTFVDRDGSEERWDEDTYAIWDQWIEVSGDGSMMAVHISDPDTGRTEIWISEVDRQRMRPLVRSPDGNCHFPALSWDGQLLASGFAGGDDYGIFLHRTDGQGEPILLVEDGLKPLSFSPDGRWLLYSARSETERGMADTFLLPLELDADGRRTPQPLGVTIPAEYSMRFSPDGRWIAYEQAYEGPGDRIYLRRFDGELPLGPEIQVTDGPSLLPQWSRTDGEGRQELVYGDNKHRLRVWVEPGPEGIMTEPESFLEGDRMRYAAVLPDGRYLAALLPDTWKPPEQRIHVVLNWTEELKRIAAGEGS